MPVRSPVGEWQLAHPPAPEKNCLPASAFPVCRSEASTPNPAKLRQVVETLSDARYRLGLADVQPDFLGRAYEYLLRKFAEGSGQSAGEFFTPTEVGFLMAQAVE
jgi:type I restriction-modification system DNA methylase subunit